MAGNQLYADLVTQKKPIERSRATRWTTETYAQIRHIDTICPRQASPYSTTAIKIVAASSNRPFQRPRLNSHAYCDQLHP